MITGNKDILKINGISANEYSYIFEQHSGSVFVRGLWHKGLMFLINDEYNKIKIESESIGTIDDIVLDKLEIKSEMDEAVKYEMKLISLSRIPI